MDRISKTVFGELNNIPVHLFQLKNKSGITVEIMEYGGRIKSLCLPDAHGCTDDICLGHNTFDKYLSFNPWLGALLGRITGKIAHAQFVLNGQTCFLHANAGKDCLHGGTGFESRLWKGEAETCNDAAELRLHYTSPDGEEGFPGTLYITATYILDDENCLHMNWEASAETLSVIDMSSHMYFNLNGWNNSNIFNHRLKVNASRYLEKDNNGIPNGKIFHVNGTAFDLRKPKQMDTLSKNGMYNPIMILDNFCNSIREVAEVYTPENGRSVKLYTTQRALQVYNAYNLIEHYESKRLTSPFHRCQAMALEPQNYPNALNIPSFPSPVIHPGETYQEKTYFQFSW